MGLSPDGEPSPKWEHGGNVTIMTLTGSRARELENVIARDLACDSSTLENAHLLVDFTRVRSIGSLELGTLIALHKKMQSRGGRLTLFNLSADVYGVFVATRLDTLLKICRESLPGMRADPVASLS